MMLSAMVMMRVLPFFFTCRAKVPKHGAKNGIQYLKMIRSGAILTYFSPTRYQFKGFTLLSATSILKSAGEGSEVYWVSPGKRNCGYCSVKVNRVTRASFENSRAKRSLYVASPPRNGCAGPTITTCGLVAFNVSVL